MKKRNGIILPIVIVSFVFMAIVIPLLVKLVIQDTRSSVASQKKSIAFNLAEAAIDRGYWKAKSSTSTFASIMEGTALSGYNFDSSYSDISGGFYRIRLSSGPSSNQITIVGEGKDLNSNETRAIRVVFENNNLPSPLLSSGIMTYAGAFEVHWGPIYSHGNINISGNAATEHFPRKFSKGVVSGGSGTNARDSNGLTPPNTDNLEWWSDYDVPELPLLNFTILRSSAQSNGTLNIYNMNSSSSSHVTPSGYTCTVQCSKPTGNYSNHNYHFAAPECHPKAKQNLIWYWDNDLWLTGNKTNTPKIALKGIFIVRGNLTIASGDNYTINNATVPENAWMEYRRLKSANVDTSASNEYPADNGLNSNSSTFNLGNQSWTGGPPTSNTDVGVWGFIYVGGNFTIIQGALADFYGALWVVGNVTNDNTGERSLIFYDKSTQSNLPTLNVVLVRQVWQEISPSNQAWP